MAVKIGLALGGGGARGLAHIGVLKVLEQEKVPIYQITGCSMGAIIGGIYAVVQSAAQTEDAIRKLLGSRPFKELDIQMFSSDAQEGGIKQLDYYLNNLKKYFSLFKSINQVAVYDEKLVKKIFEFYPEADIEKLPIRFACIATDLISGREIVINEGSLRRAVMASATIPGVFPPVAMDHQLLVDGGATDSIPVQIVKGQGAQYVFAVDVTKCIEDVDELDNALKVIYRSEDIVTYHLTRQRLSGADLVIQPDVRHYSWAAVDQIDTLISAGEQAAEAALPQIKRILKN